MKINLEDVIECLQMADVSSSAYFDRQTGEFIHFNDYYSNDGDEEKAELIEDCSGRFAQLPSVQEINNYDIMVRFADQFSGKDKIYYELHSALCGKGAFRRFKNTVYYYHIENLWYKFRDDAYKEIAIKWCKANGIEFQES